MTDLIHISETDLSDFYKDAFGFRPRGHYQEWWTQEELDKEYDYLSGCCREAREMEEIRESEALIEFNKLIDETIALGAGDRDTAIRWLMESENVDPNFYQDVEYFFWGHGLSYELYTEYAKKFFEKK